MVTLLLSSTMLLNVFRATGGDEDKAKAAAQHYMALRPYLMTRPS
jgi:hypothetical protein